MLLRVARDGFANTEEVGTEGQELLHQDLHVAGFLQAGGREEGREGGGGKGSWNFVGGNETRKKALAFGGREGGRAGGRKGERDSRKEEIKLGLSLTSG